MKQLSGHWQSRLTTNSLFYA